MPRFLVEHFCNPSDGLVHVFDGKQDKVLPPHRPDDAMMRNYFYDRDNAIERYLAQSIEGPVAALLKEIVAESTVPAAEPGIELFRFLGVQHSRTPAARDEQLNLQSDLILTLTDQFLQANGYDENAVNDFAVDWNDEKAQHAWRIIVGDLSSYLYTDLRLSVLVNRTEVPFVLGDHPAVQYNWYLRKHDLPGTSSMAAPGVQVFMPISPSHTLMLFDPEVYDIECGSERKVYVDEDADVDILNDLQLRARQRFVLASSEKCAEDVKLIAEEIEPSTLTAYSTVTLPGRELEDGRRTELLVAHRRQYEVPAWLSFSPIREATRGRELRSRHRHPEMIQHFERLRANMMGGLEQD